MISGSVMNIIVVLSRDQFARALMFRVLALFWERVYLILLYFRVSSCISLMNLGKSGTWLRWSVWKALSTRGRDM